VLLDVLLCGKRCAALVTEWLTGQVRTYPDSGSNGGLRVAPGEPFRNDEEVVICGADGVSIFDRLRQGARIKPEAILYAFDLIELDGRDMRRHAIEERKAALASLLPRASLSVRLCEHIEGDGPIVFKHACRMGLEGIVSKRKGSPWRSGRTRNWLKSKNKAAPAVLREAKRNGADRTPALGYRARRPCAWRSWRPELQSPGSRPTTRYYSFSRLCASLPFGSRLVWPACTAERSTTSSVWPSDVNRCGVRPCRVHHSRNLCLRCWNYGAGRRGCGSIARSKVARIRHP
jgi:hypothetical protein